MALGPSWNQRKPRRKPTRPTFTHPVRPPSPARSPAPKPPTPVAVPQLAAKPAAVGGPPPLSAEGETARIAARQGYGITMNDVNRQLRELATSFGGAPEVQQFGYNPTADPRSIGSDVTTKLGGIATFNPNDTSLGKTRGMSMGSYKGSLNQNNAMASLYRNLFEGQKFNEQSHVADNTFFSGMTLEDQARTQTEHDRGVAQAKSDYDSAVGNLTTQIQGAQLGRNTSIQEANNAEAAAEAERRRQAAAQAAADAASAAPAASPAAPISRAQQVEAMKRRSRRTGLGLSRI
jgi:hypothetical protein